MRKQRTRVSLHGPNIWVIRRQGAFSIRVENDDPYLIPPSSQEVATRIARHLARANKSELIVQGVSGRIRLRDSHGSDPFPPRG